MATCRFYPFLTKEKLLPNIDGVHVVGGNLHSSPWLVLTNNLSSHGAHVFNAAWTALHTLQERIHFM
jgi:hypothetical protein